MRGKVPQEYVEGISKEEHYIACYERVLRLVFYVESQLEVHSGE